MSNIKQKCDLGTQFPTVTKYFSKKGKYLVTIGMTVPK